MHESIEKDSTMERSEKYPKTVKRGKNKNKYRDCEHPAEEESFSVKVRIPDEYRDEVLDVLTIQKISEKMYFRWVALDRDKIQITGNNLKSSRAVANILETL